MATEVASLRIKVDSSDVTKSRSELDKLTQSGKKTETATSSLGKSFAKLASGAALVAGAVKAISVVTDVTREFGILDAALQTSTGSVEGAAEAFDVLQGFAATTPYTLDQSVKGFNKLVNLGLDPSERALRSYGNTAAAMGKSMMDFVEAVADASVNEWERLKEFGIKASTQGDEVAFRFRGTTTRVKNDAAAIEEYLISLGENNFADAMANRMKTLDGAISNLEDNWNAFVLEVSKAGAGELIAETVSIASGALAELTTQLRSGELPARIAAVGEAFGGWKDDWVLAAETVATGIGYLVEYFEDELDSGMSVAGEIFSKFPQYARLAFQVAGTYLIEYVRKGITYMGALGDAISNVLEGDFDVAKAFNSVGVVGSIRMIEREAEIMRDGAVELFDMSARNAKRLWDEADDARAEYDKKLEESAKNTADRLAKFRVSGDEEKGPSKEAQKAAEKRQKEFEDLVESLQSEEEALMLSHRRRVGIITANTAEGSRQRELLLAKENKVYEEDLTKVRQAEGAKVRAVVESLRTQEEELAASYESRRAILASAETLTEGDRATYQAKLTAQYEKEKEKLSDAKLRQKEEILSVLRSESEEVIAEYRRRVELINSIEWDSAKEQQAALDAAHAAAVKRIEERNVAAGLSVVSAADSAFGALTSIVEKARGRHSNAYRVLFTIQKTFALASAAVSLNLGIANALSGPTLADRLAGVAQAISAGGAAISAIGSISYAGAFDRGGRIPAGQFGLVGEEGPEFVQGPAQITSRVETRRLIEKAAANDGSGGLRVVQPKVTIVNALNPSMIADYLRTADGEEAVLNVMSRAGVRNV